MSTLDDRQIGLGGLVGAPARAETPPDFAAREGAGPGARERVDELRRAIATQAEQLAALTERLEAAASREEELRELLLAIYSGLQQSHAAIRADLARLQASAATPQGGGARQPTVGGADSRRLDYQDYRQLIERVQAVAGGALPRGATVAVVSKGDEALLQLGGRRAWHFPQDEGGGYAGHHPADSAAAIAQLEALRARGAQFLLLPRTAFWWLDHYRDFAEHLDRRYRVAHRDDTCLIFALREQTGAPSQRPEAGDALAYRQLVRQIREVVGGVLPPDATVAVVSKGDEALLDLGGPRGWHFPQTADGEYAGHHPADSAAAITELEEARARGAGYLLLPRTAFWWLDHYRDFARHLDRRYRVVVRQQRLCLVFAPREEPPAGAEEAARDRASARVID